MFLLDTGVIFAAIYQAHAKHVTVNRWLAGADQYATCGLTQIGAFRLLLADAPMQGCPLDPDEAHEVLNDFTATGQHQFVSCPAVAKEFVGQTPGHKAAFDDYLVQIAQAAGCKLATLDEPLTRRWPSHTFLIH